MKMILVIASACFLLPIGAFAKRTAIRYQCDNGILNFRYHATNGKIGGLSYSVGDWHHCRVQVKALRKQHPHLSYRPIAVCSNLGHLTLYRGSPYTAESHMTQSLRENFEECFEEACEINSGCDNSQSSQQDFP